MKTGRKMYNKLYLVSEKWKYLAAANGSAFDPLQNKRARHKEKKCVGHEEDFFNFTALMC